MTTHETNAWAPLGAVIELSIRVNATLDQHESGQRRKKSGTGSDVFVAEGTHEELTQALRATAEGTDGGPAAREVTRTLAHALIGELRSVEDNEERITILAAARGGTK